MTTRAYLCEDGSGPHSACLVPDLTGAPRQPVELLLVLESPHVEELAAGHPLAGGAGRDAYSFLSSNPTPGRSLGAEVAARQGSGDFRFGVLNVSRVPLQRKAVKEFNPTVELGDDQWAQIERLRVTQAKTLIRLQPHAGYLLAGLQARLNRLGITTQTTVAVAGKFAQLFWRNLPAAPNSALLNVPHPARSQWKRATGSDAAALAGLRDAYRSISSP